MAEEQVEKQESSKEKPKSGGKKIVYTAGTKTVPSIIALCAALISCVISIYQHVTFDIFVKRLFFVVLIFLILGTIIKMILDYAFRTLEEPKTIDDLNPDQTVDGEDDASEGEDTTVPEEEN